MKVPKPKTHGTLENEEYFPIFLRGDAQSCMYQEDKRPWQGKPLQPTLQSQWPSSKSRTARPWNVSLALSVSDKGLRHRLWLFSRRPVSFSSLRCHGLQHARLPSNPRPLSRWRHPTVSPSVASFSACPQFFAAPESFPMSQLFAPGGQSTGAPASASVLPLNNQDWFPLGLTGWSPCCPMDQVQNTVLLANLATKLQNWMMFSGIFLF